MKRAAKKTGRKRKKARTREHKRYSSDLSTAQWGVIQPLIPKAKANGRPRETNIREVVNAILYRIKNGCTWENLPKDFPPAKTVYHYFREWTLNGTIEKIHDVLRRAVRKQAGKAETPTAGSIDSQSVKTAQKGGPVATMRARKSRGASVISA